MVDRLDQQFDKNRKNLSKDSPFYVSYSLTRIPKNNIGRTIISMQPHWLNLKQRFRQSPPETLEELKGKKEEQK
ncbi:hypothetical protein EDD57_11122 [Baia soyae]|uniref:Uncharacterized protein n=1 Tax=Baia soyae TaxID=1544746 RepID=A0A4R2RXI3_9BACL|nr:hypothetical protein EDD57_11122 [Baia soyae]